MSPKKGTQKSAKSTTAIGKKSKGFTDEERAAMKERLQELKTERAGKADGESAVLAKIAEMPEPDRAMGKRLHAIIKASAPALSPKTLVRDARVCQGRQGRLLLPKRAEVQDEVRDVRLQRRRRTSTKGTMWPTGFALKELTATEEARISRAREESGELRRVSFRLERK